MFKKLVLIAVVLEFTCNYASSQPRPYINQLVSQINSSAVAYLIAANRPSYGISPYTTPKGYLYTGAGLYFNKDIYDIQFDIGYGVSNKVELSVGMTVFLKSYSFTGETINGLGDSYFGVKYKFHESNLFDHALQTVVKIPTASKTSELGTGKFDFYFGLAEGFGYKNFGYDLSIECNLLARRDFPSGDKRIPLILRAAIDSLKKAYNYKYEPEIAFTFSPSYSISDNVYCYSGYSFTRNTRLNFNTSSVLGGVGFSIGEVMSFSLGGSFGLNDDSGWLVDIGVNALFPVKK